MCVCSALLCLPVHTAMTLRPHLATDIVALPAGVKQLTKLIRKRLEERRREKRLSKLETAEQLKLLELS